MPRSPATRSTWCVPGPSNPVHMVCAGAQQPVPYGVRRGTARQHRPGRLALQRMQHACHGTLRSCRGGRCSGPHVRCGGPGDDGGGVGGGRPIPRLIVDRGPINQRPAYPQRLRSVATMTAVGAHAAHRRSGPNQSASGIPRGHGDGDDKDDDVANGNIVVIKTDGELPFTRGKVLTGPVGSSQ